MTKEGDRGAPSLASGTLANILGAVLPLFAALISVPIVLREYGPERYGIIAMVQLVLAHTGLLDFGLGRATTRYVAQHLRFRRPRHAALTLWTTAILSLGVGSIAGGALALLVRLDGAHLFKISPALRGEMLIALYAISAMIPLTTLTGAFIGGLEGRRKFALLNGIQSPLLVVGQLVPFMMLPFGTNAGLAVVGIAATRLVVLVAVMIACRRYLPLGVIRR